MSVSLVEETGAPGGNHRPTASNWQTVTHDTAYAQSQDRIEWNTTGVRYCLAFLPRNMKVFNSQFPLDFKDHAPSSLAWAQWGMPALVPSLPLGIAESLTVVGGPTSISKSRLELLWLHTQRKDDGQHYFLVRYRFYWPIHYWTRNKPVESARSVTT